MRLGNALDHANSAAQGLTNAEHAGGATQGLANAAEHANNSLGFENALNGLMNALGHVADQASSVLQMFIGAINALLGA